jgi:hypothetical protein
LILAQAINVIESPRLRKIFLLLREELKESDIPSRSTIRNHIEEVFEEHMAELEEEMGNCNFILDIKYLFGTLIEISWKNFVYN